MSKNYMYDIRKCTACEYTKKGSEGSIDSFATPCPKCGKAMIAAMSSKQAKRMEKKYGNQI